MNKKNVKTPFNIVNRIIKQSYNEQQQQRGDGGAIRTGILASKRAVGSNGRRRAAATVLDGASKLVFIETFICVGVHTCARALSTRERCVGATHALIGQFG